MLTVLTPAEAEAAIAAAFPPRPVCEAVPLAAARGRVLFAPVTASEFVPGFDRSTVDGYAVRAADTFGCSDALPALLRCTGAVGMGEAPGAALAPGCCAAVPTGGAIPPGADAVVMLEYAEAYGDGTVGVCKSAAPGQNLIFRGDDMRPGKTVLPAGRTLSARDVGALAAMGFTEAPVCRALTVGILSTGDELVPVGETPGPGRVRDVNSAMLAALTEEAGAAGRCYGILPDDPALLRGALEQALAECDVVLISGGSSVGEKDATERIIAEQGELLFHGIAIKPGKPTILGRVRGKPVFGLPGHPAAALLIARLFVLPLLDRLSGRTPERRYPVPAVLTESVGANHGRAEIVSVRLTEEDGVCRAVPVRSKSGLITALTEADGFFLIPRDREGVSAGETVAVTLYGSPASAP